MNHPSRLTGYSPDEVLATHGKSFHWARYLLTHVHADRATRLYAFCRQIDDIADNASSPIEAGQALLSIRQQIQSKTIHDNNLRDMFSLMQECHIDHAIVCELIDGILSDLAHTPFTDQDMLLRYCYRVAGTVGLMMCKVLDVDNEHANYHAIDLGIGMQLTNICRDIKEDAQQGRRYIPATIIGDLSPHHLIDPEPALRPMAVQAVKRLLQLADRYYASGIEGLIFLPYRARLGIYVAGKIYHAIGSRLEKRDYMYWQGRVTVSPLGKSMITLRAMAVFFTGFIVWGKPRDHDQSLHKALGGLPLSDSRKPHD